MQTPTTPQPKEQQQTEAPKVTPPTAPAASPLQTPAPVPPSQQQQTVQQVPSNTKTSFLGKLFGSKPTPVKGIDNWLIPHTFC